MLSYSVMSISLQTHEEPPRLLCPWDSPDKNTGVGCHFLPPDLPDPGIGPESPVRPALAGTFCTMVPPGKKYLLGGAVLNFYCNALSNPIPPGCQKFNHSQYYISFLQSLPSFRGIVRRSQRWDSSNNCLHSYPLRCSSFSPRGCQPWCSLAGAKSFLSRLSVLKIW